MPTLNLGILAHVDAGKTSLTERLLFRGGAIHRLGSVDGGNTQTDSMALERERGITIKSAVASFMIDGLNINLIDTPGHPDFIAEVERVLSVLDGAILVISAVEGVQAQTRILMRALQRLQIPLLIFVNKIDRRGADLKDVLASIQEKLSPALMLMGESKHEGSPQADFQLFEAEDSAFRTALIEQLTQHNDQLLERYIEQEEALSFEELWHELASQSHAGHVYPVFAGSAISGAGIEALLKGIKELLPHAAAQTEAELSGLVFKIERDSAKQKIAYIRLFAGCLQSRERFLVGSKHERATAIQVFAQGGAEKSQSLVAGQIGKVWGLTNCQIGDVIGVSPYRGDHHFAPPTLESLIVPVDPSQRTALHQALVLLSEQDPLINLRINQEQQELFVSLYGEVQKEVIQSSLERDFAIGVTFRESSMICIERVIGSGEALEIIGKDDNPFVATLGLRIEAAPPESGIQIAFQLRPETVPLFIYKTVEAFETAISDTLRATLQEGLYGWEVHDCRIVVHQSGYVSPISSARDFRLLAPLVLMQALVEAGTCVCEPLQHFRLEIPLVAFSPIWSLLARLGASPQAPDIEETRCVLHGEISTAQLQFLQQQVAHLSHGEGVLEYSFGRYKAIEGKGPMRARSDRNPLNRKEYLMQIQGRL
jgi:ribosomal protection tetracycline resistance protein